MCPILYVAMLHTGSVLDETEHDQGESCGIVRLDRKCVTCDGISCMLAVHSRSIDVSGYIKMISNDLSNVTWNIRA